MLDEPLLAVPKPVGATQPQRLNYRHEAIIKWLIANPDLCLADCAAFFGYTQGWLSVIIHSDAFQAQYRTLQDASYDDVRLDIKAKITGLAHMALDKLAEQMPLVTDPRAALDVADKTLKALGYGTAPRNPAGFSATNVQINQYQVSASELAEARRLATARADVLTKPNTSEAPATLEPPIETAAAA